ncbi:hypothetical protein Cgig2_030815 [Carnegiea gigantea]|uniref:Uncharacterized protein n=1 Tax=Carnegiea gigantea TaxID=171969 RepID=A0A9Q1KU43_9CARY|nr:hypothetical protein Cgig2_030815 [Carnegiea gigantea]
MNSSRPHHTLGQPTPSGPSWPPVSSHRKCWRCQVELGRLASPSKPYRPPTWASAPLAGKPAIHPTRGRTIGELGRHSIDLPGRIRWESGPSSGSDLGWPLEWDGSYSNSSTTMVGDIPMLAVRTGSRLAMDTSHRYDTGLPEEYESRDKELLELSLRKFGLARRTSRNRIAASGLRGCLKSNSKLFF